MDQHFIPLPNGTRLHLDSAVRLGDARYIVWEIFENQMYKRPGFQLQPTDVVLEVGAHVGVFAHWAAPQLPQGRLICVEPTSSACCLEHSLTQNGFSHVRLLRWAVGAPATTLDMIDHPKFAALNRTRHLATPFFTRLLVKLRQRKGKDQPQLLTVPCRSLEEIMTAEGLEQCDFLKIDCEGGEFDILAHTPRPVLRRFRRIVMEFHEFHPSHRWRMLRDRLVADGFVVQVQKPWLRHLLNKTGMIWATRID